MSPVQLAFVQFILCGFLFGFRCAITATIHTYSTSVHDSIVIHVTNTTVTTDSCVVTTPPNEAKGITKELACPTLNLALQAVTSISTIYLYSDVYTLKPGNETRIENRSAISIIGIYPDDDDMMIPSDSVKIVDCQNQTGLSFIYTNNIIIESVKFSNCTRTEVSTSRNFLAPNFEYLSYQVAIFMKYCINVSLVEVTVSDTDGVGMTLYNTIGTVSIANCTFSNNKDPHGEALSKAGGGGLQIELSDKLLCSETCTPSQENMLYSSGVKYSISNTEFYDNAAHYRQSFIILSSSFSPGSTNDEFNLGKGGGFSIILRGAAENNTFVIDNCDIYRNDAHWGGGFYVSFQESSSNNVVQMRDTQIGRNRNFDVDIYSSDQRFDIDGGGGGGKILYSSLKNCRNNKMVIEKCTFRYNEGVSGGGLWVESVLGKKSNGNRFELLESNFVDSNEAFLGSAAYFSGRFMKHTAHATIQSTRFENSSPICSRLLSQRYAYLPCSGALYAINFPLILKGKLLFQNNHVTALEIHDGKIDITEGTELTFIRNSAQYGGALALYDCSFMTLYPNTSLSFNSNTAEVLGGAIYSASCSGAGQPAAVSFRCFVGYSDPFLHPEQWETVIMFDGNMVGMKESPTLNDMYVTSLQACWWPQNGSSIITKEDYGKTFCWKPWRFNENCTTSYLSSPAFLSFNYSTEANGYALIYPGQALPVPVVYDGTFRQVKQLKSGLIACILSGVGSFSPTEQVTCTTSSEKTFLLYWPKGKDFKRDTVTLISMEVNQKVTYGATTFVMFRKCQWPLYLDQTRCVYDDTYFSCDEGVTCEISSPVVPKHQYCISKYDKDSKELIVGVCPPLYSSHPTIRLNKEGTVFSTGSCQYNQSGRLCGGCEDGYAVPLNSLHYFCYKCDKQLLMFGWAMFLLLQILPLTLLVLGIFIFGVDLSKGTLTGLVFYWQMVSLNVPSWFYPAWFSFPTITSSGNLQHILSSATVARFCTFIYGITNLNFLVAYQPNMVFPICISHSMDALSAITFWYIVPVYALALTAVITLLVQMYYKGYACVRNVAVPIHKCLARLVWRRYNVEVSVIKSVASVYILCFTQISATSFQILHYSTWHSLEDKNRSGKVFFYNGNLDYFGMPHALFGVLAIIILLLLVILPMLFVVLYPSKFFHRFVMNKIKNSKIKITLQDFGDTFTGCYKSPDGQERKYDYRYFAGLLLFLRLMILCFYYIPGQHSELILTLEAVIMLFFAGTIMIFRPFTAPFSNYINFFLVSTMVTMSALCLIFEGKGYVINLLGTVHIPLLLIMVYWMKRLIARLHGKLKPRFTNTKRYGGYQRVPMVDDIDDDDEDSRAELMNDFADRLEHPEEYCSQEEEEPSYQDFKRVSSTSMRDSGHVCTGNTGSTIRSGDSRVAPLVDED